MVLVSQQSGVKYQGEKGPVYWGEDEDFQKHFFNSSFDVFSDKLAKLTIRCNEKSNGAVFERISKVFQKIYVDEVQDLAGYDLEVIRAFMLSDSDITLVGDPRQIVYLTHNGSKYRKYRGKVNEYLQEKCKKITCSVDTTSLNVSYRNPHEICELSAKLYPELPAPTSAVAQNSYKKPCLVLLHENEVHDYLMQIDCKQLRYRTTDSRVHKGYPVYNFGESKGLEFNNVILFPTNDMLQWLATNNAELEQSTRAKLYVAITRASKSVAVVVPNEFQEQIAGFQYWKD
jgi:DNA helicase-2/ATP-dependent DNA helicase PcrA